MSQSKARLRPQFRSSLFFLHLLTGGRLWKIGATTVTSAAAASLTAAGAYGTTAYTLNLTIPFTKAAGLISNTINFVATAN